MSRKRYMIYCILASTFSDALIGYPKISGEVAAECCS